MVSELLDRPPVAVSLPIQPWSESSLAVARPWQVQLDLENLACFEVVNYQFQHQGVIFDNAIALWPSNPAFPPRSGTTVLMGAPKTGLIEAKFLHPVSSVSGFVTSPRCTVLSAYDHNDQLIAVAELTEGNLANSNSSLPANAELFLTASNIYRVVFSTFGSHLTLDDISFSR
ncbi:hypothetical protein H6F72_03660 [Trichocoleus sp. FACHB-46]|nr:hypothetical protein [Trichocoleus sp. FACHB-46]